MVTRETSCPAFPRGLGLLPQQKGSCIFMLPMAGTGLVVRKITWRWRLFRILSG